MRIMVLSLLLCLCAQAEPPELYHWPLELPRVLTSSFGEYRPGRFHAGIDLRTGGVGLPVYAAADGHVSRLRCSPWGYGKAVYLQFDDGNSAVYGHLDDFAAPLRVYVREKQHEAQSYTVDLHVAPGRFRVKRGELIAYSGQTGIGAPHLHYELRDEAGVPENPRHFGLTWPDVAAPEIKQVCIVPGDASALVEGGHAPIVRTVARGADGVLRVAPVRARGRVGFGADLVDPGAGGYSLGVHSLVARAGDRELFRVQHDHVDYTTTKCGAVAYHPMLKEQGRFLLSYRWEGMTCDNYAHTPGDGLLTVGDAPLEVLLNATDFHGNACSVVVPVEPLPLEEPAAPHAGANARGEVDWNFWGTHLGVTVRFAGAEMEHPVALVEAEGDIRQLPFRRVSDERFSFAFAPARSGEVRIAVSHPRVQEEARSIHFFHRGTPGSIRMDGMEVDVPANAPYGLLALELSRDAEDGVTLWPSTVPLAEGLKLRMPFASQGSRTPAWSVYRKAGGGFSRLDTRATDAGLFEVSTTSAGSFVWKKDSTTPLVGKVSPPDNYTAETRRPKIEATVSDDLSGVDRIDVRLNGIWLLVGYDPERQRIFWERDHDLPVGTHDLVFRVTDAAGNEKVVERRLTIPEGARPAKAEKP